MNEYEHYLVVSNMQDVLARSLLPTVNKKESTLARTKNCGNTGLLYAETCTLNLSVVN